VSSAGVSTQLATSGVETWFVEALERIARGEPASLEPFLVDVGETTALEGTNARCRCHFVRLDAQKRPRVHALTEMLVNQVIDYAIPRSRINEATEHFERTGSTSKIVQLEREAKGLFTRAKTSGEGGELLLYALLELALRIPQVLCKMSLKTSTEVHYHGVDGVHAVPLDNGQLAVYWGEAKMYKHVNQAIDAAFASLAPILLDEGDGAAQRDVLLLRDNADTGDPALTAALVRYFTSDTMEASELVVRGACLVGFSHDDYESPHSAEGEIRAEVATALEAWRQRAQKAITNENLASFELEVFLIPVPSVEEFRDALLKKLGLEA
jgi:HamA